MITLLLTLTLFAQGLPVLPGDTGTVSGVLRTAAGTAASGIRIAAMLAPGGVRGGAADAGALFSQTQTDEAGRYRLENIPPGNYYIAAGRVDQQTYYPGTLEMARGKVVPIARGASVTGIDFVMDDTSVPVPFFGSFIATSMMIPVQVTIESAARLPVFSPQGFTLIRLTRTADGIQTEVPLNGSPVSVSNTPVEYRVSLENLPDGYVVKSIMYGSTDLTINTLKISAANLFVSSAQTLLAGLTATSPASLSVTLATIAPASRPATSGVRVSGRASGVERRSVYISGIPGILYSDGTFEFSGVPPGRHAIATLDNPDSSRPVAASIVVGNRNVEGVELRYTPVLPLAIKNPVQPGPAGTRAPGSMVPLASVRGRVVEETSREPVPQGTVFITGHYGTSYLLDPDGQFEIPRLLPGNYNLEIQAFGHRTISKTLIVGDEDINLDLSVTLIE